MKLIDKKAVVTHISQEREIFGHFCGLDNVCILSGFRHYGVVLICLDPS